jgi:hypothetical protein
MNANREILMKFITGQNEKVKQDISMQGYKDNSPYRNNTSNTIYGSPEGTSITMQGVSKPLVGMDEFGNKQEMLPGQNYQYPGSRVIETSIAKYGGLLNKTITCENCGWSWKAADGGSDITTCHKCGHVNNMMQQGGTSNNPIDWTKQYVNSPKYKERITNAGYDNPDKQIDRRLQNLENVNILDTNNPQGTVYKPFRNTIETSYPADVEYYNIHKNLYPTKPELNSIIAHELGHSETNRQGSNTSLLNKRDREELKNRLVPESYDDLEVFINGYMKHDKSHHNIIPEENKADLNSFRYDLRNQYDAGNQDFTEEHLKNSPNSFAKERLLKNYSKDDLIWLMNNVAQNNNSSEMPMALRGGTWFGNADEMSVSNKYQQAGTIKTFPMWNQNNNHIITYGASQNPEGVRYYKGDSRDMEFSKRALYNTIRLNPSDSIHKVDVPNAALENLSIKQSYDIGGTTTVAEQYTQITGKPWSTARAEGLTDGSAKQNLALIERLKTPVPVVVEQDTTQPIAVDQPVYSNDDIHRRDLAKRVVQLAEERIKNNNYVDVPSDIKEAAYQRGEVPFGCIGGACTVLKDAGVMKTVDWSNTHFAENAKDY